jgi:adenylate cyclase
MCGIWWKESFAPPVTSGMIATSMVDGNTGAQLWNDRFDLSTERSSAVREVAVRQIAKGIRIALFDEEAKRAARELSPVASATDLWLRGALLSDGTLKGDREAKRLFEEALQLDPRHVGALIGMEYVTATELYLNPQASREQLVRRIDEYSTRAVEADRRDPRVWIVRAQALALQWRWAAALQAMEEVLTIDPGRSDAYTMRGLYLMLMARSDEAFAELNKAIGADPRQANDAELLRIRCRLHLGLGRYDDAISDCERSAALDPFWLTHVWLAAAYGQRGYLDKAAAAKVQVLRQRPEFTIASFKALNPSDVSAYWAQIETHVFPGLRKAGVPES